VNAPADTRRSLQRGRAVFLIARREFLSRVRSKVFLIGTAVVVALLAVFAALQVLVLDKINPASNVGFTGQAVALQAPFQASATAVGINVRVHVLAGEAEGESEVRSGSLDALVSGTPTAPQVLVNDRLNPALAAALDAAVKRHALDEQLSAAGVDPRTVEARAASAAPEVRSLEPPTRRNVEQPIVGFVTAWVLYIALALYGNFIAQGVVEDKASRIVEILLAAVRPPQLLLGKVIGIGLVGLLQLAVIGTASLALFIPTHVLSVPNLALSAVGIALLWFTLGFVFYGMLYAAAGSLISRQEDVATAGLPMTMLLLASILLAYIVVIPGFSGRSLFPVATTVLSLLPPFAPVLMPLRLDSGDAPLWQALLSVVLALAGIAALTLVAGRIYANSVLRIGARIRLSDALRRDR
jgi:ABC-2 type transport system permease protein